MIMKRRDTPPFWTRFWEGLLPKKGWRRGFDYLVRRMRRLPDSPHRIALGFAWGTFVSFSPFYTLHIPITLFLTWMTRGNLMGGFIGTFVGNALTTPFMALAAITTGNLVLGYERATPDFHEIAHAFGEAFGGLWQIVKSAFGYGHAAPERLLPFFHDIFLPYMIGGAIVGALAGVLAYFLARPLCAAYQARRRLHLMERAKSRVKAGLQKLAGKAGDAAEKHPAE